MRRLPESLIQEATQLVLNTRDFCGNEKQAVKELASESGYSAEWQYLFAAANFRANAEWNRWQKAAGINPKYTF